MRRYTITARFHEAPVKDSLQRATATGRTLSAAVSRALREILARPGIKKRRHRTVTIVVAYAGSGPARAEEEIRPD
jgi:hypothetical protein